MSRFSDKLKERIENGSFRELKVNPVNGIDFYSNDYLGFATNNLLERRVKELSAGYEGFPISGSTGSRLISGHFEFTESLENEIAKFHKSEAALLYNSGYDANVGLLSCIASKGDTFIYDELCHASIIDGMRLSLASRVKFRHNYSEDLELKLKNAKGEKFVVVESIYSMDGHYCNLAEVSNVCKKYNAHLIVDEAHATGVFGPHGTGLSHYFNITDTVFARIHTFGKALGCHGAAITCNKLLKDYLINFSRSFIYTTALPLHSLFNIKASYELLKYTEQIRLNLFELIHYFNDRLPELGSVLTPIQIIKFNNIKETKSVALLLNRNNIQAKAILPPTVPLNGQRIRICLHAFNTKNEIDLLIEVLKNEKVYNHRYSY